MVKTEHQNGEKGTLSDCICGMVVGVRRAGLKNRKYPMSSSPLDEKASQMKKVREKWPKWDFELKVRQQ